MIMKAFESLSARRYKLFSLEVLSNKTNTDLFQFFYGNVRWLGEHFRVNYLSGQLTINVHVDIHYHRSWLKVLKII